MPLSNTLLALLRNGALLVAILLIAGVVARQTKLLDRYFIFFPERDLVATPAAVGLTYEDVEFTTSDGVRLHGWFVPGRGDVTLLWFHGNAGNISHRIDNLRLFHSRLGVNVFIFDYRGYGRSEGGISENGTYLDGEAAIDYLRSRPGAGPDGKIVLFGRSLGGAVAIELATRHEVHGVVVESAFTSVAAMGQRAYPYLPAGLITKLLRTKYDSLAKINRLRGPLMVIHGDRDELVPFAMGRELFDAAGDPKSFYTISGAGHNDTYLVGGEPYFQAIKAFIDDPAGAADR